MGKLLEAAGTMPEEVRGRLRGASREAEPAEIVANVRDLRRFSDQPVPEIVQSTCQTSDPEFLWMNEAMLLFSDTVNLATSKLEAIGHALTPEFVRSTPQSKGAAISRLDHTCESPIAAF